MIDKEAAMEATKFVGVVFGIVTGIVLFFAAVAWLHPLLVFGVVVPGYFAFMWREIYIRAKRDKRSDILEVKR